VTEDGDDDLLHWIKDYVQEEDKAPTNSKVWREGGFPQQQSKEQLQELCDEGVLERREVVRGGQECYAYFPV